MKDLESQDHQFGLYFKGYGNLWGLWVGELNHWGIQQKEMAHSVEDNWRCVKCRGYLLRFGQCVAKLQGIMLYLEQATPGLLSRRGWREGAIAVCHSKIILQGAVTLVGVTPQWGSQCVEIPTSFSSSFDLLPVLPMAKTKGGHCYGPFTPEPIPHPHPKSKSRIEWICRGKWKISWTRVVWSDEHINKIILGRMEAQLKAEGWGQEGNTGLNWHGSQR